MKSFFSPFLFILLALTQCLNATFTCTKNGYFANPDPTMCDTFYVCQGNGDGTYEIYLRYCPYPLIWNSALSVCGSRTATCCKSIPNSPCLSGVGAQPSTSDCTHFFLCDFGIPNLMACPNGLIFNSLISTCDWPSANCSSFCSNNAITGGSYTYGLKANGVTCTPQTKGSQKVSWDASGQVSALCVNNVPIVLYCCGSSTHLWGSPGYCQ